MDPETGSSVPSVLDRGLFAAFVEKRREEGVQLLKQAAEAGEIRAHYHLGRCLEQMRRYKEAIRHFKLSARHRHLSELCYHKIGVLHFTGRGDEERTEKACQAFMLGSSTSHPPGTMEYKWSARNTYEAAKLLHQGSGQKRMDALKLFRKAAQMRHWKAMKHEIEELRRLAAGDPKRRARLVQQAEEYEAALGEAKSEYAEDREERKREKAREVRRLKRLFGVALQPGEETPEDDEGEGVVVFSAPEAGADGGTSAGEDEESDEHSDAEGLKKKRRKHRKKKVSQRRKRKRKKVVSDDSSDHEASADDAGEAEGPTASADGAEEKGEGKDENKNENEDEAAGVSSDDEDSEAARKVRRRKRKRRRRKKKRRRRQKATRHSPEEEKFFAPIDKVLDRVRVRTKDAPRHLAYDLAVFIEVPGHPKWPAVVVKETHPEVTPGVIADKPSEKSVLFKFFNDPSFFWIDFQDRGQVRDQLSAFYINSDEVSDPEAWASSMCQDSVAPQLVEAIHQAKVWVEKMMSASSGKKKPKRKKKKRRERSKSKKRKRKKKGKKNRRERKKKSSSKRKQKQPKEELKGEEDSDDDRPLVPEPEAVKPDALLMEEEEEEEDDLEMDEEPEDAKAASVAAKTKKAKEAQKSDEPSDKKTPEASEEESKSPEAQVAVEVKPEPVARIPRKVARIPRKSDRQPAAPVPVKKKKALETPSVAAPAPPAAAAASSAPPSRALRPVAVPVPQPPPPAAAATADASSSAAEVSSSQTFDRLDGLDWGTLGTPRATSFYKICRPGRITKNPNFHDKDFIYPIGFFSLLCVAKTFFGIELEEDSDRGLPVFVVRVFASDRKTVVKTHRSTSFNRAWGGATDVPAPLNLRTCAGFADAALCRLPGAEKCLHNGRIQKIRSEGQGKGPVRVGGSSGSGGGRKRSFADANFSHGVRKAEERDSKRRRFSPRSDGLPLPLPPPPGAAAGASASGVAAAAAAGPAQGKSMDSRRRQRSRDIDERDRRGNRDREDSHSRSRSRSRQPKKVDHRQPRPRISRERIVSIAPPQADGGGVSGPGLGPGPNSGPGPGRRAQYPPREPPRPLPHSRPRVAVPPVAGARPRIDFSRVRGGGRPVVGVGVGVGGAGLPPGPAPPHAHPHPHSHSHPRPYPHSHPHPSRQDRRWAGPPPGGFGNSYRPPEGGWRSPRGGPILRGRGGGRGRGRGRGGRGRGGFRDVRDGPRNRRRKPHSVCVALQTLQALLAVSDFTRVEMFDTCVILFLKLLAFIFVSLGPTLYRKELGAEIRSVMDSKIDPCTDFYQYSCGGWLAKTKLPKTSSRYTRSFNVLDETNEKRLLNLLSGRDTDPDYDRLFLFYDSCVHLLSQERLPAVAEVLNISHRIDTEVSTGNPSKFADTLSYLHYDLAMGSPFFAVFPSVDTTGNPEKTIAMFDPMSVTTMAASMYNDDSVLQKYTLHIQKMLGVLLSRNPDDGDIRVMAEDAVSLEKMLVGWVPSRASLRNPYNMYHRTSDASLISAGYSSDVAEFWHRYLQDMKIQARDPAIFVSFDYMKLFFTEIVDSMCNETTRPEATRRVRNYLKWHVLNHMQSWIPDAALHSEHFSFFGKELRGQSEMEARDVSCVKAADRSVGDLLGRLFVSKFFPEEAKEAVVKDLQVIKDVFKDTLTNEPWMDSGTRMRALLKLRKISDMIGYPEKWDSYSDVTLSSDDYFRNQKQLHARNRLKELARIGKPTDKTVWEMTAPQVNAYYEPTMNEMCFPAGILQFPFYDHRFPEAALSFGGIGSVIGHELSHAFDDEGSQFDEIGRLKNWWSPSTRAAFDEKTRCIKEQYSQYSPLPGYHVNGNLTSGENIADNAGVKDAFAAMQISTTDDVFSTHSEVVDELTLAQLFFVQFGQLWCTKMTDQAVIDRVLTDPHSPPMFRVIGTVSNSPDFAKAFSCKEGAPMNPKSKCSLF